MCSAVPFKGSIIGTRRSGSVPMSNTRESQLAVTTASGQRARHLPRNQARVPEGGSVTAVATCAGSTSERRPRRLNTDLSGRRSWYCNASAATRGSFQPHEWRSW